MRLKSTFFLTIIYAVLLVSIPSASFAAYKVGDIVTDFTLADLEGNQVSLYDFSGQIVLLNFFETS